MVVETLVVMGLVVQVVGFAQAHLRQAPGADRVWVWVWPAGQAAQLMVGHDAGVVIVVMVGLVVVEPPVLVVVGLTQAH